MKRIYIYVSILVLLASILSAKTRREAVVAGQFYPADKTELQNLIDSHLANIEDSPEINGEIIAIIVPHAGLIYSGQIAAHAYKLLEGSDINHVIMCGPSHQYKFPGISIYGPYIAWSNPLGNINCNAAFGKEIMNFDSAIVFDPSAHAREHSLEVQLPYLQTVLGEFTISPLAMGNQDLKYINILADALKSIESEDKTIMLASTDLQHYRSADAGWPLDEAVLASINDLDPIRLERLLRNNQVEMCGGGPVVAVMKAAIAKGANSVRILKYGHSGEISGNDSSVVGYVSAVIYKDTTKTILPIKSTDSKKELKLPFKFEMTESDQTELLKIARASIESYLTDGIIPEFEVSDNLKKFGAGFVTLKKKKQLRGCIGYTSAVAPLFESISECAVKAAVSDPRFPPVRKNEIDYLKIEISVLTPMQEVSSWDEIEIGRDGLMIFKGEKRGLLLPQVAVENGWDRKKFLEMVCSKAGLSKMAYKSGAIIYKFQAVIFSEE